MNIELFCRGLLQLLEHLFQIEEFISLVSIAKIEEFILLVFTSPTKSGIWNR